MSSRFVTESVHVRAGSFLHRLREFAWEERRLGHRWIFRGQGLSDTWKLLPSAHRLGAAKRSPPLSKALERADAAAATGWHTWEGMDVAPSRMSAAEWDACVQTAARLAHVEASLVRAFVLSADRATLPVDVPAFLWHLPNKTLPALARFVKGQVRFAGAPGGRSNARAFALGQHHGIPTPLLDWTYSPAVAAYFAAEQALDQQEPEDLAVWALSKAYLDLPRTRIKRVTVHARLSDYRDAQQGLFTWHPEAYLSAPGGVFTPFDLVIESDCPAHTPPGSVLQKFVLARGEASELFNMLGAEHISRATLMPGFDSVTKDLEFRSKWGW